MQHDMDILAGYVHKFADLRCDRSPARWSEATTFRAPHKPLLLLAVIDLFAQGNIRTNCIELTEELGEIFARYWARIVPSEKRGNIAMPFFHLRSDGFWHLLPKPGMELVLQTVRRIHAINQLHETVLGAELDPDLFEIFQVEGTRNALRLILIESYFAAKLQPLLAEQSQVNKEAYLYSQELLKHARTDQATLVREDCEAVRDQGFRRAIVTAYRHQCAFCGIRVLTSAGHTAVDAAHIVPWSESHNDDPRNGMALCKTCHWNFDEGLLAVSQTYRILLSKQLSVNENMPGYLPQIADKLLQGPSERVLWPDKDNLDWHLRHTFDKC